MSEIAASSGTGPAPALLHLSVRILELGVETAQTVAPTVFLFTVFFVLLSRLM
jgi:hypothetical protein